MVVSCVTGIKPEKKPATPPALVSADIGVHGLSKLDCATEWFLGQNWNWTMSPTAAVKSDGVNFRFPSLSPTCTTITFTWSEFVLEGAELVEVPVGVTVTVLLLDCAWTSWVKAAAAAKIAALLNNIVDITLDYFFMRFTSSGYECECVCVYV